MWNKAAEKIFGYTEEEALGKTLHKLLVPTQYHASHYSRIRALPDDG